MNGFARFVALCDFSLRVAQRGGISRSDNPPYYKGEDGEIYVKCESDHWQVMLSNTQVQEIRFGQTEWGRDQYLRSRNYYPDPSNPKKLIIYSVDENE